MFLKDLIKKLNRILKRIDERFFRNFLAGIF